MTWLELPPGTGFGPHNLPYGAFSTAKNTDSIRLCVAIGDHVLDVAAVADDLRLPLADLFSQPTLNRFLAQGPAAWREARARITGWLAEPAHRAEVSRRLVPAADAVLHLPFAAGDYVDFYASRDHAQNAGRIFRPGQPPLTRNWAHMPLGYHGRAGTLVVSGTCVTRPQGQRRDQADAEPSYGPSRRLDIEAEVGFLVGTETRPGQPVPVAGFEDHVFGACLVNDWSARDIQSFETVPLGPFLSKSFATSVSPWVVPLEALRHARVPPPPRDPVPLPYLRDDGCPWGLDITLSVSLNGHEISRPPFATMYWTGAQMLAHLTSGGARVRAGDLYASGTVSGPGPREQGCLLELSWNGTRPVELPDGTRRGFLADGDEVVITGAAPGPGGEVISLGEVRGQVNGTP
jgi:fumarylacetoacetase